MVATKAIATNTEKVSSILKEIAKGWTSFRCFQSFGVFRATSAK
ncbi:hypothetical protein RSSM_06614 [Rhodopirellula sallentina SM41]|uniref:Uncharacterized protein n=1 Tax=Rhodopirellula sallentina SM41 TaxID=1263870 RepID=M5U2A1_9BACT|nr:hypothetical protein RSSM_06614 [Rhodopirellula sallentina SM41]